MSSAPSPPPLAPALRSKAVSIRTADSSDLDSVMAIMASSFSPTYGEGWTRSQCAGILPMTGVILRLATRARKVAGFALMRVIADEAELLLIAVSPDVQSDGIGAALLADFVALAKQQGATRLHLEVRDGNPAMKLYERAGFTPAGRRHDYYRGIDGRPRDALTLAKTL